ncbi:MAG: hypothetical protein V5A62_17585 [Haloarculaceae archaeon]
MGLAAGGRPPRAGRVDGRGRHHRAGVGGAVSTYRVPPAVVRWDLPFKLLAGTAFLVWITRNGGRVRRRDGTAPLIAHFVYVVGRLLLYSGQ